MLTRICKQTTYISILLCFAFCLCGCKSYPSASPIQKSGFYFDTIIQISVYDSSEVKANEALSACFDLAQKYENLFSKTIEGSDVYKINASHGAPVIVDSETISLLLTFLSYAELSEGYLDPTIGSVSSLWDFKGTLENGVTSHSVPSKEALSEACSHVDYTKIYIDPEKSIVALSDADAKLDLGCIAKGYVADRMKESLLESGIQSAIINLGGNVLCVGAKPDGSPFEIGIRNPLDSSLGAIHSESIKDTSAVTSGSYERMFSVDGKTYHHILNPFTGYPIDSDLLSVTILSPKSVDGDALSTLCFILGYEKSIDLLSSLENTSAVFVMKDGTVKSYNH